MKPDSQVCPGCGHPQHEPRMCTRSVDTAIGAMPCDCAYKPEDTVVVEPKPEFPAPQPMRVHLVDFPRFPIETIYAVWMASRERDGNWDPAEISSRIMAERQGILMEQPLVSDPATSNLPTGCVRELKPGPFETEVLSIFRKVIDLKISVAEMLDFVFILDDVPISLREQMVRHRVGIKVGPRLGADMVPEFNQSSYWSQTMRVMDMSKFFDEGHYLLPESIVNADEGIRTAYLLQLENTQNIYAALLKEGIPAEDARNLLPIATTHRMAWKINLASLMHVVGKRGCWILQLGVWGPLIRGMIEELALKVHPFFRSLVQPPCISHDDKFTGCVFKLENENRVSGKDPIPPCPLYLHHHSEDAAIVAEAAKNQVPRPACWVPLTRNGKGGWQEPSPEMAGRMVAMCKAYSQLWGRNPVTGERISRNLAGELTAPLAGAVPETTDDEPCDHPEECVSAVEGKGSVCIKCGKHLSGD